MDHIAGVETHGEKRRHDAPSTPVRSRGVDEFDRKVYRYVNGQGGTSTPREPRWYRDQRIRSPQHHSVNAFGPSSSQFGPQSQHNYSTSHVQFPTVPFHANTPYYPPYPNPHPYPFGLPYMGYVPQHSLNPAFMGPVSGMYPDPPTLPQTDENQYWQSQRTTNRPVPPSRHRRQSPAVPPFNTHHNERGNGSNVSTHNYPHFDPATTVDQDERDSVNLSRTKIIHRSSSPKEFTRIVRRELPLSPTESYASGYVERLVSVSRPESPARPEPPIFIGEDQHENSALKVQYVDNLYGYRRRRRNIEFPVVITALAPFEYSRKVAVAEASQDAPEQPPEKSQPIFQVQRFLASPHEQTTLRSRARDIRPTTLLLGLDGKLSSIIKANAIDIESDAGTILTIHSIYIIDAIERIAGRFPGLIDSGDSLIIPEPFCALLYYREQLLAETIKDELNNKQTANDLTSGKEAPIQDEPTAGIAASHIMTLYTFLDKEYLRPLILEKSRWAKRHTCTFEWIWLLFAPKTLVYEAKSFQTSTMRAFQVSHFSLQGLFNYEGGKPTVHPARLAPLDANELPLESVIVTVLFRRQDGRTWIDCFESISIAPFKGEKPIRELPIFPASFADDPNHVIRQHLIERGKRYQKLGTRGQVDYHGDTLSGVCRRFDGRVLVDPETFKYEPHLVQKPAAAATSNEGSQTNKPVTLNPDTNVNWSKAATYAPSQISPGTIATAREARGHLAARLESLMLDSGTTQGEMTFQPASKDRRRGLYDLQDDEYIICAPDIEAYVLKEREWVLLAVESMSDCVYEERMIDDLQISQEAKSLVQALSHNFQIPLRPKVYLNQVNNTTHKPWSADFVPGKGGGRIILLHGKPGVGKTSTAECIAELAKRPLLTITCGDLGTDAMSVDGELTRWLRLGTLWNAVLLFDEADVFLEARAHGDIDRNSLVSVFLRALEYYQGLMFLTTNRIGSFDEAIISRIHVVLHLPNLSDVDRERIWSTSFRKLEKERLDISVEYSLVNYAYHDEDIRKLDWNGREIRNAFNTMIALAEWDAQQNSRYTKDGKVEVRREHLQEVAKMSAIFKQYLESLRQMEHEEYIRSLGLRDDKFRPQDKR